MGVPELKEIIKLKLETADERLLRIVDSVLNEYSKETVAFDTFNAFAISFKEVLLVFIEEYMILFWKA